MFLFALDACAGFFGADSMDDWLCPQVSNEHNGFIPVDSC